MGYATKHMGRRPKAATRQFLNDKHVLEPTRAARVLYIVLFSQKEFVDNVVIQEPLGSSDPNQLHFNIKIKSDKTKS